MHTTLDPFGLPDGYAVLFFLALNIMFSLFLTYNIQVVNGYVTGQEKLTWYAAIGVFVFCLFTLTIGLEATAFDLIEIFGRSF